MTNMCIYRMSKINTKYKVNVLNSSVSVAPINIPIQCGTSIVVRNISFSVFFISVFVNESTLVFVAKWPPFWKEQHIRLTVIYFSA